MRMMHKQFLGMAVAGGLLFSVGTQADTDKEGNQQQEEAPNVQENCPVMGGEIDKELYVEAEGKRIYTCCKGCLPKVRNNPKKYIEKLESEDVAVEKAQTECPVMGREINKEYYVDIECQRIYLCCPGCIDKVKADPEKYIKTLREKGITLAKNTKCTQEKVECTDEKAKCNKEKQEDASEELKQCPEALD